VITNFLIYIDFINYIYVCVFYTTFEYDDELMI